MKNWNEKLVGHFSGNSRRYLSILMLLACMIALYFLRSYKTCHKDVVFDTSVMFDVADALILAVVTGIAIGFLLDFKEWREYFGSHIRDLIMDNSYLSGLKYDKLNGSSAE
jgi:hypothetical protein